MRATADLPWRLGVGIALFNGAGHVFSAKRIDTPGDAWQMPQGGIDGAESPREAALRELEEEIGTAEATILAETHDWLSYDLPPDLQGRVVGRALSRPEAEMVRHAFHRPGRRYRPYAPPSRVLGMAVDGPRRPAAPDRPLQAAALRGRRGRVPAAGATSGGRLTHAAARRRSRDHSTAPAHRASRPRGGRPTAFSVMATARSTCSRRYRA